MSISVTMSVNNLYKIALDNLPNRPNVKYRLPNSVTVRKILLRILPKKIYYVDAHLCEYLCVVSILSETRSSAVARMFFFQFYKHKYLF